MLGYSEIGKFWPILWEEMPTFKIDVGSSIIGELMISFSLIKVGACSPILGEHMHV